MSLPHSFLSGKGGGVIPFNITPPVITGTVSVGSVLSCSTGIWSGSPAPTFTYQWQRVSSNISGATSSSYTIVSGDAGGTVRCVVTATNSVGAVAANSNNSSTVPVIGQQAYTTAGSYSWVPPSGVTSVSVVAIGGGSDFATHGGSGDGGGLGYRNTISVTPGSSYTVVVGTATTGTDSYFDTTSVVKGGTGGNSPGNYTGDGGGNGGNGGITAGGGAGGYSGSGGNGGPTNTNGYPGNGGGGGGGHSWYIGGPPYSEVGGGGGGVGFYGEGTSGVGGQHGSNNNVGGSGGGNGTPQTGGSGMIGGNGGAYGGGGGNSRTGPGATPGSGSAGAVRIIWSNDAGTPRAFPSTNTGNL